MKSLVAAFVVAAIAGGILTPLVRALALRVGAVSRPGKRHVNRRPIPRLGGVGICLAFFSPLVALFFVESSARAAFLENPTRVFGLFAGGLAMCAVGALDDTRGLRALYKLYAQLAVAAFAFACGFRIDAISLPIFGNLQMGVFSLPMTVLWVVGIINAVNLIDGLDGLAAGVAFFAALTNFVVAYIAGSVVVALFMAAMMGAVIGFLFYNFNPARIFMGDSGSYFLGFVLAATSLVGTSQKTSTAVSLLVPIVALGVPIVDTIFSMVRRFVERRPLFSPDRGHIHHRLLDMGITHRRAVLILYAVSVLSTAAAIAVSFGRSWQVGLALFGATVALIGLVRFVGYFEYLHLRRRQRARLRTAEAERLRWILPSAGQALLEPTTEPLVLEALAGLAKSAGLSLVEVLHRGDERVAFRWVAEESVRDLLTARYPVGGDADAKVDLKFGWTTDAHEVSPDVDILLQLLADILLVHLVRVRSRLAPARSAAREREVAGLVSQRDLA